VLSIYGYRNGFESDLPWRPLNGTEAQNVRLVIENANVTRSSFPDVIGFFSGIIGRVLNLFTVMINFFLPPYSLETKFIFSWVGTIVGTSIWIKFVQDGSYMEV